jgi:steroid delta-isomerase-like uncharacterized protein
MQEEEYTIPQMVEDVREGKMPRRRFFKALTAMGISAVGVGAIAAAAAHPFAAKPASQGDVHEAPERQIQLHDQHLAHQSRGNTGALHNDYAENAVVEDSMYGQPFVGRAAILARKNVGFGAIPDLQIKLTNRVVHGSQVCAEWVASGTHTGDFAGLPASGRAFSIHGVTVVVRQHGKIVRESIYYDMAEVRRLLG